MKRKYEATLSCPCGYAENLSDKDYEKIIKEEEDISLKCGHWKYGAKIQARHKVDTSSWVMHYGSNEGT